MTFADIAATHRRASLLLALVVAVGSGSLAIALELHRGDAVPLVTTAPFESDLRWTETSIAPATQQRAAAAALLDWLVVVAGTALVMAAVAILTLWAQQAALRAQQIAVHRAIGASRRNLLAGSIREGSFVALAGGFSGALIASLVVWTTTGTRLSTSAAWPGSLALFVATVGGALFPLWAARTRRVTETSEAEPPLGIAALQLGAALAVLVTASLLTGHAANETGRAGSTSTAGATVMTLAWSPAEASRRSESIAALLDGLRPSAGSASITTAGAHEGLGTIDHLITDCGRCFVGGIFLKWRPLRAVYRTATADTFDATGIRLVEGRIFTRSDDFGSERVAVVNLHLARRYFEDGRAVGRLLYPTGRMTGGHRVIGVVTDDRPSAFGAGAGPLEAVYLSTLQHPPRVTEILLSTGSAPAAVPPIAKLLARETRADVIGRRDRIVRWFGAWFGAMGATVTLLAILGTVSLVSIWVRALAPELAVRRAVGAPRSRIVLMILARIGQTAAAGVGIGLVFFGPVLWPELARLVPGIEPWDAGLIARAGLLLATAAVATAAVPALRAARASPTALWTRR